MDYRHRKLPGGSGKLNIEKSIIKKRISHIAAHMITDVEVVTRTSIPTSLSIPLSRVLTRFPTPHLPLKSPSAPSSPDSPK